LSGRRRISSPIKHITTTKFKKLNSFNSKVKAEITQTMIINTGQLSKNDHRVLTALIASDKVWCSLDNLKVHILELMLQQTESIIKTLQEVKKISILNLTS
jgi:hypothetical protein